MKRSWKEEYHRSLKSMDTEEHIDLAFYRPIGFMWACLAERLGIYPNAITIASIFLGIKDSTYFSAASMYMCRCTFLFPRIVDKHNRDAAVDMG